MDTLLNKIHILYTIPNFDTAGSGKVVYDLVNNLDKNTFRVSIACRHNNGAFFKEIEALGVPIYIMEITTPLRPYYNLVQRLKPYRAFLKKEKIDLVHSWHWSSDWSEALACLMVGVPFVYTKKAMGFGNIHWKIRSYLAEFIITVNPEMQSYFPNKKNQKLIPFGLDTDYFSPTGFKKNTSEEAFKLITVANLVEVKGIETLLYAMSEIREVPVFLDIVGDTRGPYADTLKSLVTELNLTDRVFFLGKKRDVRPLVTAADVYVIPSKNEGMPMALVEAMAMGIPVLGSDISGIRYVLKDFEALLFPVSDSELLGQKICELYKKTPEERKLLGNALRQYAITHFSMTDFIAAHETLYSDVLNKPM